MTPGLVEVEPIQHPQVEQSMETIVILGNGPAGCTAAIYAARANMNPLVISGPQPGGQLTITSDVENFPGFPDPISGPELVEKFRKQAERFGARFMDGVVTKADLSKRPFKIWVDEAPEIETASLIVATGARARFGKIPGEQKFYGKGISACATCDGFFFKNQDIAVVGGGDSAMEEAHYLTHFAKSVTIIHRRQEFRASKFMVERIKANTKIHLLLDSVVEGFTGDDLLDGVQVKHVKTNEVTSHPFTGLFYAIGHNPNTDMFRGQLDLDDSGYLTLPYPHRTMTKVAGVFAAGDVADPYYRQAITSAGMGCQAAMEVERWLCESGVEAFCHTGS
jgi:thioredoxin reductase (NADPH)